MQNRGAPLLEGTLPARIDVRAPARLHLGFLDLERGLGRRFGSLGLTVEGLETQLRIEHAAAFGVEGEAEVERCRAMLDRLAEAWHLPPVRVTIDRTIPAHAGLGSGTQLALALGGAAARLAERPMAPRQIAQLLQRGTRSGIGIGAFEQGGFILDGGRSTEDVPPPVVARLPFPDRWRLLLIFDLAREGLARRRRGQRLRPPATVQCRACRPLVPPRRDASATRPCRCRPRRRWPGYRRDPARGGRLFRARPERPLHQPGRERSADVAGGARVWRA